MTNDGWQFAEPRTEGEVFRMQMAALRLHVRGEFVEGHAPARAGQIPADLGGRDM
jgi:hypothetical protein